jgi:cation:H+ antiporter
MTQMLLEFVGGLALLLAASRELPRGIERLGDRLRPRGGHLGLLTALGANSPEITAGITGLASGTHAAGYGVVVGSNLFNLAGLLGLSALVAGRVELRRQALVLHGGVALAVAAAAIALLHGLLPAVGAAALIAVVFVPYVVLVGLSVPTIERLPASRLLAAAVFEEERAGEEHEEHADAQGGARRPTRRAVAVGLLPPLAAVVVGGVSVMRGALGLAGRLGLSDFLVAAVVLAALTGLPNVYSALRLARHGHGRAVVSETLNSNTLNLIVGVALPALVVGTARAAPTVGVAAWWLLGATLLALALTARRTGLGRPGGAIMVASYLAFLVVNVVDLV